jgi:hypothetical protein
MDAREILRQWEAHHRPLSDIHRKTFLARSEVVRLAELPRSAVEQGLLVGPKLTAILREARRIARSLDDEAERAITLLRLSQREVMARPPHLEVAIPKVKYVCRGCAGEFVDERRLTVGCRRCGTSAEVRPVCRGCGQAGDWRWRGRCQRCFDAASVAADEAGPTARGPDGTTARNPDRRKGRWTGQHLDRPE